MPTALVTGINGFTGRYLAEELRLTKCSVVGLGIDADVSEGARCDLTDRDTMLKLVPQIAPDIVFHLGGIAFAAHDDVESIYRTNIVGTRNLLEALTLCTHPPKSVILASSAHIYGNATTCPIDESTTPAPASDYAISKLAMEYVASMWLDRLPITFVRPFNYTGVGQSLNFLLPKIVDHFRRRAPVIELGNLDVIRDFSDVRDVANIYLRLSQVHSRGQLLNLCSGVGHSLKEILTTMADLSGHRLEVTVNPIFVRDNEVHTLIGSGAKLDSLIGHTTRIPLRETLAWMLKSPP
jgi:GDP-6-deoxy-D-talose 4-dehydrogenase